MLCRLLALLAAVSAARAASVAVTVNLQQTTALPHYWSRCVGSGHALLGTRNDWRQHLINATRDIGFEYVRMHGILDDDMSVVLDTPSNPNMYNVFQVYDFLQSIGVKPIVELSFMPSRLVDCGSGCNNSQYAFNNPVSAYKGLVMPPTVFNDWYVLVNSFTKALVQRYGIATVRTWYFEVWNELWGMRFPQDYIPLYNASVLAVKAVDEQLRVGGPATMQVQDVQAFVNITTSMGLPVDFVSTHLYPTDPNCQGNQQQNRDCFAQTLLEAQQQAQPHQLFITEFNDGLGAIAPGGDLHRDMAYGAAFIFHNVPLLTSLPLWSWWTFTDVFEEGGMIATPFHNQFGLQSIVGVAKPVYRAFQLLRGAGDRLAAASANSTNGIVTVMPTVNSTTNEIRLYISNFQRLDMGAIPAATVTVALSGLSGSVPSTATLYRLDDAHLNPVAAWQSMGSPDYPTPAQVQTLMAASVPAAESVTVSHSSTPSVTVTVPANAAAVVIINGKAVEL